jgi:cytidyltransferase-like protein
VILCSGAFDGIHAGHVRYLAAAKALCLTEEVLLVAVAPDAYIRSVKAREPYWSQRDRLVAVQGLQAVDATIAQGTESVASLIREFKPRVFVKGPDWKGRLPEDVQLACEQTGTAIAFVETPGVHTSEAHG